jgi:hypothetical protein
MLRVGGLTVQLSDGIEPAFANIEHSSAFVTKIPTFAKGGQIWATGYVGHQPRADGTDRARATKIPTPPTEGGMAIQF